MSFIEDFAKGFLQSEVSKQDTKRAKAEELDLYRKKKLEDLSVQKELGEHEARRKEAAAEREAKRLAEVRKAELAGFYAPQGEAVGAVSTPEGIDPVQAQRQFTEAAAAAFLRGDNEAGKSRKAMADSYKIQQSANEKTRNIARQPILSSSGADFVGEYAKAEQDRVGSGSTKFATKRSTMVADSTNPENLATINAERNDSGLATNIVGTIAEKTADETGKTKVNPGKIISMSENLVILKNKLKEATTPEEAQEHLKPFLNILQELDSYSQGLGREIGDMVLPAEEMKTILNSAPKGTTKTTEPQGRIIFNRKTGERMIEKDGKWQKL